MASVVPGRVRILIQTALVCLLGAGIGPANDGEDVPKGFGPHSDQERLVEAGFPMNAVTRRLEHAYDGFTSPWLTGNAVTVTPFRSVGEDPMVIDIGSEVRVTKWISVPVPDLGVMRAAVATPSGPGPFPVVVVLHGTHGFAPQYVEWADDLARAGFIAVAPCWFSGGGGSGADRVASLIPCPEIPPLGAGEYPETVRLVDAVVQAARALPGARRDRLALVGHSRGGGAIQQYLLAGRQVNAAVLHSSGYALRPGGRADAFSVPLLIMHGTADGPADGGGPNNRVELAREFEAALRKSNKPVETAYTEGGGHNTFFTSLAQRDAELKRMIEFLLRHLTARRKPGRKRGRQNVELGCNRGRSRRRS